jgi:Domain of unknown function (DUF4191)
MPRKPAKASPAPAPHSRVARKAATATAAPGPSKRQQLQESYRLVREDDRWLPYELAGILVGIVAVFVVVGLLVDHWIYLGILGLLTGFLVLSIYYGRRVTKAVNARLEKRVGGAAGALTTLRRGWTVDSAVAATRNQDLVHRVVGRPGIVLVGEGVPSRLTHLITNEKRKHSRVAPDVPIYEVVVGAGDGQVSIPKLPRHLMRLPNNLDKKQIGELKRRLKALEANRPQVPIPKGPMPKNIKLPKGGVSQQR